MSSRKNHATCSNVGATCNPSPTRSDKHQITPLKGKNKTFKHDRRSDVHTLCSTPDVLTSKLCNEFISPTNSLAFSQDSHPEVIWDYTSPKLPKGVSRKEINMTVDEFLKNMYHDQVPEYNKQASQYTQLLEKWMTTNETALEKKPQQRRRRDFGKKNSRRIVEEMKQFLESIQINKGNTDNEDSLSTRDVCNIGNSDDSNKNENLKGTSFLWGDDDMDSNDELWGDIFDSNVIVQATQELESCSVNSNQEKKSVSASGTLVCTIPETVSPQSPVNSKCSSIPTPMSHISKTNVNVESNNNNLNNCDEETSSLGDLDWDKGFDENGDDWDDAFVIADESFSSIPDDILQGVELDQPSIVTKSSNSDDLKSVATIVQETNRKSDKNLIFTFNETEVVFANGMSQIREYSRTDEASGPSNSHESRNLHWLNSFEPQNFFTKCDFGDNSEELFDDDDILCKPEVLNLVDELESQLSQEQKCTPDEIRQKKYEALKRRQKSLRNKKPLLKEKL